jgi:hypothetical protein
MDYVIKNHKNLYIRLNKNGSPVTCAEHEKSIFEYSKAKNILNGLPKTLKRLNFMVDPVPDISQRNEVDKKLEEKVIENENYIIPNEILEWIEKFGICDDILKEAQKRRDELNKALSEIDKEFVNIIHEIEFEGKIDLYGGWQERNRVKENREKRRKIKDELLIISSVLKMNFRNLDRSIINKIVAGLAKRKFTYRVVEEEDIENVV